MEWKIKTFKPKKPVENSTTKKSFDPLEGFRDRRKPLTKEEIEFEKIFEDQNDNFDD